MVSKLTFWNNLKNKSFRAVLFRMVSKQAAAKLDIPFSFRAVLFRMVSKQQGIQTFGQRRFRAVLFRMVSKQLL